MVQVIARSEWWVALSAKIFAFLFFPIAMLTAYTADQAWEVIGDFEVKTQLITKAGVVLEGVLDKKRACRFIEATALTSDGQLVPVTYESRRKFGGSGVSRPLGVQSWGPWTMDVAPGEKITMNVRHRCHFAWEHTEEITTFMVASTANLGPIK